MDARKELNHQRLLRQLRFAEDEVDRAAAAEQLAEFPSEITARALIDAFADRDSAVQAAAIEAFRSVLDDPRDLLSAAMRDTRESVRWGVAELLEEYPSEMTEATLRLGLSDTSAQVRGAAARSLRTHRASEQTINALRQCLEDREPFPRYEALKTLQSFGALASEETDLLRRGFASQIADERIAAINYVRQESKREWLPTLVYLVDNEDDERVRKLAVWAVGSLSR